MSIKVKHKLIAHDRCSPALIMSFLLNAVASFQSVLSIPPPPSGNIALRGGRYDALLSVNTMMRCLITDRVAKGRTRWTTRIEVSSGQIKF